MSLGQDELALRRACLLQRVSGRVGSPRVTQNLAMYSRRTSGRARRGVKKYDETPSGLNLIDAGCGACWHKFLLAQLSPVPDTG